MTILGIQSLRIYPNNFICVQCILSWLDDLMPDDIWCPVYV